jgi:hypothetical protein
VGLRKNDFAIGIEVTGELLKSKAMVRQKPQRAIRDTLLLSIWVLGYRALIRSFAALQSVEQLLGGSKR